MSKAISVSTGPIVTIFSPSGRYLREFSRTWQFFPIPQGTLLWQPILWQNCGKITYPLHLSLSFWNGIGYRYLNERINSVNDTSILCEIFVKFGPVVFELKWGRNWKLCCDSAEISRFSFIWHTGVWKRIGMSQFWFPQFNRQSFLVHGVKIWWDLN